MEPNFAKYSEIVLSDNSNRSLLRPLRVKVKALAVHPACRGSGSMRFTHYIRVDIRFSHVIFKDGDGHVPFQFEVTLHT